MPTTTPASLPAQGGPDEARPKRIRPDADEVTTQITSEPVDTRPRIAPDIPVEIDPGGSFGVLRQHGSPAPGDDPAGGPTETALSAGLVAAVQSVRGYPCVSLLLATSPGARMTPGDAQQLERLRTGALARLRQEDLLDAHSDTVVALDRLVQDAMRGPTDLGLALFAGCGRAVSVRLGIEVESRAVIDPTFATRDLVRALHRTPRHVVLVLSAASGRRFPMRLPTGSPGRLTRALRAVDQGLGAYLSLHPAPVVVAGPQSLVVEFCSASANLTRLAGTIYGGFDDVLPAELARRTRPVLDRYLASRERAALDLLDERTSSSRVASGIAAAWLAARAERPEMLVVEDGYRFPAHLSPDGDQVWAAEDATAPDVIDDLVDELIEVVLDRGGWVALAREGSLSAHDRVALTLRE